MEIKNFTSKPDALQLRIRRKKESDCHRKRQGIDRHHKRRFHQPGLIFHHFDN